MGPVRCCGVGLVLAFALVCWQAPGYRRQAHELDFVDGPPRFPASLDATRAQEARITGSFPTAWDADAKQVPFELTLVELDRTAYSIGDPVVFKIVMKHVGTEPFAFPWSMDAMQFSRDAPVTRRATFMLRLKDEMLGSQVVGDGNTTFGAESVPGSLMMLAPGDSVTIRAHGLWYLEQGFPVSPPDGWVRTFAVRVHLQVAGVQGVIPIVESSNEIQSRLQQR
jgi:hypothetical protein